MSWPFANTENFGKTSQYHGVPKNILFTVKEDDKKFSESNVVLAALSETFKNEFKNNKKTLIDIEKITSEAFAEFLQFFREKTVILSLKNIRVVLDLVTKYKLDDAKDICRDLLRDRAIQQAEYFVPAFQLLLEYKFTGAQSMARDKFRDALFVRKVWDTMCITSGGYVAWKEELQLDVKEAFAEICEAISVHKDPPLQLN